jgi:exodeoxyribonuclease VII large subunit
MQFDFTNTKETSRAYTVIELNREVRSLLENAFESIWVEAEVAEVKWARSGHVYFTMTDPDGKAQLSAVMWQGFAMRYGNRVVAGAGVRCHGRATLYEARGSYQLVVDRVEEAGKGLKARILADLKEKLAREGLFDKERKRPLPEFPVCIGVVTSREGAAIRDIIKIATRRFPVHIALVHAQVQGESAPKEIVRALRFLAGREDVDVIIVGRGGGSSEDLDAFNNEAVVRAVAEYPKPVISAVGHEIDMTLVDLAADVRAATPSEAAEIATPDREALLDELVESEQALRRVMEQQIGAGREKFVFSVGRLRTCDPRVKLRGQAEILAGARQALAKWPELTLTRARADLALAEEPISLWSDIAVERASMKLAKLTAGLEGLSPLANLSRGYSVARKTSTGDILRSAGDAPPGTEVDVRLARGSLICDVKKAVVKTENDKIIE